MLRFASPLPRNYHEIVKIYTKTEDPVRLLDSEPWDHDPEFEKWHKDRAERERDARETKKEDVIEVVPDSALPVPSPLILPAQIPLLPVATPSLPIPSSSLPVSALTAPFVVKPVITTMMNDAELLQSNLDSKYMEQRDQMIKIREEATKDHDIKVETKVDQELKMPEPSQNEMEKQKQLFDEQQAALRALRATSVVSESKAKVDIEQPLPPPNQELVKPEVKAQPMPLPEQKPISIDSMKVDQLKQLCVKRGLATKGKKEDLVARLKEAGVHSA